MGLVLSLELIPVSSSPALQRASALHPPACQHNFPTTSVQLRHSLRKARATIRQTSAYIICARISDFLTPRYIPVHSELPYHPRRLWDRATSRNGNYERNQSRTFLRAPSPRKNNEIQPWKTSCRSVLTSSSLHTESWLHLSHAIQPGIRKN